MAGDSCVSERNARLLGLDVRAAVLKPAARARERRAAVLRNTFPDVERMRVLDLGGRPQTWSELRPAHVTVVNLEPSEMKHAQSWCRTVAGDACDPHLLSGESFDLVFSNSVLEHVGGHAKRVQFAANVHRLGLKHWIQTPYRYFPIEPHHLVPGLQWIPRTAQISVIQRWPLSHSGAIKDRGRATNVALWTELVSVTEMCHYFPRSLILRERYAGMVKSLIAVRS